MSIAAQLEAHKMQLGNINEEISRFLTSVRPETVSLDPKFHDDLANANPYSTLSIYQLNQKQREIEETLHILNELWLVKTLFTEIGVCFDPFVTDNYVCDLDELSAIVTSLRKAEEKVYSLSAANAAVAGALESQLGHFRAIFVEKLDLLFDLFFPEMNIVNASISVNEDIEISLKEYIELCNTQGASLADSYIQEKFRSRRKAWENDFLGLLISKQMLLDLENDGPKYTLYFEKIDNLELSIRKFLSSLLSFVSFINVMGLPSLKQFYSTMISNALVETISSNIEEFMSEKKELTAELVHTIEMFTKTGWPMPLRNVFVSTDKIHDSLQKLYLNWLGDKYINEIRGVFALPGFLSLLADTTVVEEQREVMAPIAPSLLVQEEVSDLQNHRENVTIIPATQEESQDQIDGWNTNDQDNDWSADEQDNDWNGAWGSDLEEDFGAKKSQNSNSKGIVTQEQDEDWNDNWGDDWEEEQEEEPAPLVETPSQKVSLQLNTAVELETIPLVEQHVNTQRIVVETRTLQRSSVPLALLTVLDGFSQESNGADPQLLLDTILALSYVSYPPLLLLFLLLNDIAALESEYLIQKVTVEWLHTKKTLFNELLGAIIEAIVFDDTIDENNANRNLEAVTAILSRLVESDLIKTNNRELRELLLQALNMINSLALEKIFQNSEITEQQSEFYTEFLHGLKIMENEVLSKVGESVTKLSSWPKVDQVEILLNHHLKEIMRFFYDSKFYSCSTEELVQIIKSVFISSDLREQCIEEVLEIRNTT